MRCVDAWAVQQHRRAAANAAVHRHGQQSRNSAWRTFPETSINDYMIAYVIVTRLHHVYYYTWFHSQWRTTLGTISIDHFKLTEVHGRLVIMNSGSFLAESIFLRLRCGAGGAEPVHRSLSAGSRPYRLHWVRLGVGRRDVEQQLLAAAGLPCWRLRGGTGSVHHSI